MGPGVLPIGEVDVTVLFIANLSQIVSFFSGVLAATAFAMAANHRW
jgi:hypothetical protein